ncbi:hypothetical protein [Bradyrhizobium sp. Leo121]|uniref:hypothetical protein n=1 Tax=Bradyrhizobium sp. Leo121 TaxID=1571195 RepID=UPI0010E99245|nr:hypothetical protein [Bradyrhizobium sp. Leo121]RZN34254.1 hypothetical protein CWO90_07450 [Bradyrhizobium sp. Leo121]
MYTTTTSPTGRVQLVGVAAAIVAGLGVCYLRRMLGDVIRVEAVELALNDELRLLIHPDIRKSGRIYAFMTHCVKSIKKLRD